MTKLTRLALTVCVVLVATHVNPIDAAHDHLRQGSALVEARRLPSWDDLIGAFNDNLNDLKDKENQQMQADQKRQQEQQKANEDGTLNQGQAGPSPPTANGPDAHNAPVNAPSQNGGPAESLGSLADALRNAVKKNDWEFCSTRDECKNNCCSNLFSDDGKLKCTPGGCSGSGGVKQLPPPNPESLPKPLPPSKPLPPAGTKGEWEFCTVNDECANKCCSAEFSDDHKLKCTPGGCGGGNNTPPKPLPVQLPDILGGNAPTKPSAGSNDSNNTPPQPPTPNSAGGSVPLKPTPNKPAPAPVTDKGKWEFCSINSECANNCCSKKFSDDGKLKCTPGGC